MVLLLKEFPFKIKLNLLLIVELLGIYKGFKKF
jgi:hypothetical protein